MSYAEQRVAVVGDAAADHELLGQHHVCGLEVEALVVALVSAAADGVEGFLEAVGPHIATGVEDAAIALAAQRPLGRDSEALESQRCASGDADDADIVYLAVMTGLRRGELLGLRWQDIDLDGGVLCVRQTVQRLPGQGIVFCPTKTHRSARPVAISPDTTERLRARSS